MAKLHSMLVSSVFFLTLAPGARADGTLPLKRVRLYETGVGYFERTGGVSGKHGGRLVSMALFSRNPFLQVLFGGTTAIG